MSPVSPVSHELLMQLHDDELAPAQAAALERRIADEPEATGVLRGLDQVGVLLREVAAEQGARADDLADRVMACLDASEAAPWELRALDDEPPSGAVPISGRWRHIVPAVAGVLALAATAVLVARSGVLAGRPAAQGPPRVSAQLVNSTHAAANGPAGVAPAHPAAVPADGDAAPSVSIETVDFGAHDGTIFMVSVGRDATPVVWLIDEPANTGGRMKPL